PTGWTSGVNISSDLTTGRGSYVKTLKVLDSPDIMTTNTFQFIDAMGIAVASAKTNGESSTVIDAKCLPLGIYFVTAYGNIFFCKTAKILIK
ncbi:MAG: hypothetical protein ACI4SO_02480, partial [Muribaculaceae bacterium]